MLGADPERATALWHIAMPVVEVIHAVSTEQIHTRSELGSGAGGRYVFRVKPCIEGERLI